MSAIRPRQQQPQRGRGPCDGFTLIELMVAIAVFGILAAIAIPVMHTYLQGHRFSGAVLDVLGVMREARIAAVERRQRVVFQADPATGVYRAFIDDGQGSADADSNGILDNAWNNQFDAGERVILTATLPRGVTFNNVNFAGNAHFHFNTAGLPLDDADILTGGAVVLADDRGQARTITLVTSGHTMIN